MKDIKNILKNAPYCSILENNECIRFDTISNLKEDVMNEIETIEEDNLIEEARETMMHIKRTTLKKHLIRNYTEVYNNIKREHKELKNYLKYLNGGK